MAKNTKLITPKEIPTDISRDFPGRFHVEVSELKNLVQELEHIVRARNGQQRKINYWVRLENGTLYNTTDIEVVLRDENENSRLTRTRITLLVIIADLMGEKDTLLKRIVVQFSRARVNNPSYYSWEHIQDETFNLNFHGINFRVRDKDRKSAMDSIEKLQNKVERFRKWYSVAPGNYEVFRKFLIQGLLFILYGLVCFLPAFILQHAHLPFPFNFPPLVQDLLAAGAFALIAIGLCFIFSILLVITITLFIPPSYFEIGYEIKEYQKGLRTKIVALIGVIIIGILTGLLQDFIEKLFIASNIGASR